MDGLTATNILIETSSICPSSWRDDCIDLPFTDELYPVLRRAARAGASRVYLSVPTGPDAGERLAVLRAMPGLTVLRPAEPGEIAAALRFALLRTDGPTLVLLCKATMRCVPGPPAELFDNLGGWVVREPETFPELVLLSSGAELAGTLIAAERLALDGVQARVISVPWRERFLAQRRAVLDTLLPASVPRLVVEDTMAETWWPIVAPNGAVLGGGCGLPTPRQSPEETHRTHTEVERIRAVGHDVLISAAHGW